MNNLQSYTPLAAPLYYDSLAAREGCEETSGNTILGFKAYTSICVFGHDPTSKVFNQPDTVSYSIGPVEPGEGVLPFHTFWAAWVGSHGVRIGKMDSVTPPANETGVASALYPDTVPAKISHAFNDVGLLFMAIPSGVASTEIKWYTNTEGATSTITFGGTSCVLFNNSLLDSSIKSKSGVAALYLRPELPASLFVRFEGEPAGAFSIEHVLMPDLRAQPKRLIQVSTFQRQQILRYIDRDGRDVKLTSPIYGTEIDTENKVTVKTELEFGIVHTAGVLASETALSDKLGVSSRLEYGFVYRALIAPAPPNSDYDNHPLPSDNCAVTVELDSGEVI